MASTHTSRTQLTSQALAATASVNGTEWNNSAAYGGIMNVRLTNGGTAPTTVPTVTFYTGDATGVKQKFYTASGDTVSNSVTDISCIFPMGSMFNNVTITWGATTGGTVEAYAQELTTI